LKASCDAILDVRTSAHHHLALLKPNGVFSACCASVTKVTRSRQTVKLTLYHRTETLRALIYRRLIHRTEPNRPHISSDISISNSVETKRNQMRPKSLARLACIISVFLSPPRCRPSAFPLPSGPSGAPSVLVSAAGEEASTVTHHNPQPPFSRNMHFSAKYSSSAFRPKKIGLNCPPLPLGYSRLSINHHGLQWPKPTTK